MVEAENIFFTLLRLSIGTLSKEKAASVMQPYHELDAVHPLWSSLLQLAKKQSLAGMVYEGMCQLPKEVMPPLAVRRLWMVIGEKLRKKNQLLFMQSAAATRNFLKEGFRSCILKGQGNAMMYPNPYRRQPGDIDIWLDGKRWDIFRYVRKHFPKEPFKCQHIEFPVWKDTVVEVHFFPSYTMNVIAGRHLKRFFKEEAERQFTHQVALPDGLGAINMPTPYFNAVYQLTHINLHFLIEGIGLRQFLDYFYVLRHLQPSDHERVRTMLNKLNLLGFARAVLYVEREVFGLEEKYMFAPVDECRGKDLLQEVMISGNFGRYDERFIKKNAGFWSKQFAKIQRNMRFVRSYPSEELSEPLFRLGHYVWRQWYQLKWYLFTLGSKN